jgi:broad specificity phosphatase PhoE
MNKICVYIVFSVFFLAPTGLASSGPRIYFIRHAKVNADNPGWSSSKDAYNFKEEYNRASIHNFDPEPVLNKIKNYENVDTVFCSPQLRAMQTAAILFDTNHVVLIINDNLMELQYNVISFPVIQMPTGVWLTSSLIFWMAGINTGSLLSYEERKNSLEDFAREVIDYAERHGECIIVAHGVVNRELLRILKKKGWKRDQRDGYGNLSVNSLVRNDLNQN